MVPHFPGFRPFLEEASPLLSDFTSFLTEFEASFGDADKARTSANKLRILRQGTRPTSVYASEFRQLAVDVNWGETALIDQLRFGLRNDVKDLLVTLPDPTTLSEAIYNAIRCDNRLLNADKNDASMQTQHFFLQKVNINNQLGKNVPTLIRKWKLMQSNINPLPKKKNRDVEITIFVYIVAGPGTLRVFALEKFPGRQ